MDIKKLIKLNELSFDGWAEKYEEFLFGNYHADKVGKAESERIFFQTNELLISIANNFFAYGRFKDQWDTSKCSFHYLSQYLFLKSSKMDVEWRWGLDSSNFFLECYLHNGHNIRYMTDNFWKNLLDLKALGDFEFLPQHSLSVQKRTFFENKTSTVFQLIRNYMVDQIAAMNSGSNRPNVFIDTGCIRLTWPPGNGWPDLLERSCRAFKLFYSINYQLWKVSHL